ILFKNGLSFFACTNLDVDWNVGHSLFPQDSRTPAPINYVGTPFAYSLTILFKNGFPAFGFIKE
ncbi:hypothetical protein M4D76_08865, partial [Peribacillus frigoritolerans]|uniref:hypothetical protein n=1 Tax=Peribacillus frigoritolerans TaxID=450367 RepID=UPI0021A80201